MVTSDEAQAAAAVAAGGSVVLIVAPDAPVPPHRDGPRPPAGRAGGGRLAVLVGTAADPAVEQAARDMHAELFGAGGSGG